MSELHPEYQQYKRAMENPEVKKREAQSHVQWRFHVTLYAQGDDLGFDTEFFQTRQDAINYCKRQIKRHKEQFNSIITGRVDNHMRPNDEPILVTE